MPVGNPFINIVNRCIMPVSLRYRNPHNGGEGFEDSPVNPLDGGRNILKSMKIAWWVRPWSTTMASFSKSDTEASLLKRHLLHNSCLAAEELRPEHHLPLRPTYCSPEYDGGPRFADGTHLRNAHLNMVASCHQRTSQSLLKDGIPAKWYGG